ncbi:MAG: hypothetical protein AAF726_02060 [Planctomycetota bacterium]
MRTLTNGHAVLDPTSFDHETWTFAPFRLELPVSGRSSWWGAFRRGDHIGVQLVEGHGAVDVRILGRGFRPLSGATFDPDGGALRFQVPTDGVYHVSFDGPPKRPIEFRFNVRIPRPDRRILRPVDAGMRATEEIA